MASHAPFSGQLYQLSSKSRLHAGAYVEVNGPYDRYGKVIKSEEKPDGSFLNLIRGVKKERDSRVVCKF